MSSLFGAGAATNATTPAKAKGLQFTTAAYGPPMPVVYGRNQVTGNVIDYLEFQAQANPAQQGGKGGAASNVTSYNYSCTYLVALAEGPITSINGLWDGSTPETPAKVNAVLFLGTATQSAWSHLTGDHAINYRYTAYVAFAHANLGGSPSLPNYTWDVTGLLPFAAGTIDSCDASAIWDDICTSVHHGINWSFNGDLTPWSDYCVAAGLFQSPVYDQTQTGAQTISDLAQYTNTAVYWSEGALKIVPYGDTPITGNGRTYTPNVTPLYDLTDDDFIAQDAGSAPVAVTINRSADTPNQILLEVLDASNQFTPVTVEAKDQADIDQRGVIGNGTDSVHQITDPAVGRQVAQLLLQRALYIRRTYQFRLSWKYCALEPMDIVTLTDSWLGLGKFAVRITEVAESADGSYLDITAEEFPAGIGHAALYDTQPGQGFSQNLDADPGPVQVPFFARAPGYMVTSPEIWVAVGGTTTLWGGCAMYTSYDNETYQWARQINIGARYGVFPNGLATSASDPDTTDEPLADLYAGVLTGGSQADADNFTTAILLDTEVISYETATPTAQPDQYELSYLRRGGYNTTVAEHAANAPFIRIDGNLIRVPFDAGAVGQTLYVKFQSFNVWGRGVEDLSTLLPYTYVIGTNLEVPDQPATPEDLAVTGVADGVQVRWTNPNPAAVRYSSVERSTDGTDWTVVWQGNTEAFTDQFTDGANYYYRGRACGQNFIWSGYTVGENAAGRIVPGYGDLVFDDLVINGTFEGSANWVGGTYLATGGYNNSRAYALTAAAATAAYAQQVDGVGNQRYIPVQPGDRLLVECRAYRSTGDASAYVQLTGFDAHFANPVYTMQFAPTQGAAWPISRVLFTVPEGVYFVRLQLIVNSDGTVSSTWAFDDIELYKNAYYYSNLSPSGVPQGLVYTCNATGIIWHWTGVTILLADNDDSGITIAIPNGTKTFAGLTASTTYYGLPYYDLSASAVAWGGNALFTDMTSAGATAALLEQNSYDHIPLSQGALAASTTASGGGGGAGGGWGPPCVTADSEVLLGDGTFRVARDLVAGDVLAAWIHGKRMAGRRLLRAPTLHLVPTLQIIGGDGRACRCSTETPFDLPDGRTVQAAHMDGECVLTDRGWRVARVVAADDAWVARINLGGASYASRAPGARGWTVSHNTIWKP